MKIPMEHVLRRVPERPPGYLEEILTAAGLPYGSENFLNEIEIPDEQYEELIEKYQKIRPIPKEEWPSWAVSVAYFSKEGEKGVGSTIHRIIGEENSERFKAWFRLIFNRDCGCAGRQQKWDSLYRY